MSVTVEPPPLCRYKIPEHAPWETKMKRVMLIGLTLCALAACETIEGAGKDISKAGQAISSASRDVQSSM